MLQQITTKEEQGFEWIDVLNPDHTELQNIAARFNLHETSVNDCLQPDHLPKYESTENYSFVIFRVHTDKEALEADTVQELTNKMAIFFSRECIITIHRKEQPFLNEIAAIVRSGRCKSTGQMLNILIRDCLMTYDEPSHKLAKAIDYYEENVFLRNRKVPMLKGLYYLRRKIDLIKRILILSYDIIDNIDNEGDVNTRDTRDLYIKLQNVYDSLFDNVNQLLNVYFSIASQRTNEIMRVLTIISVFFMPLTFIVGIYGMNFRFMPELDWHLGYPAVMLFMGAVTTLIYLWFRKKGWL